MSLAMNWPGMGDPTKRRKTLRFLAMTAIIAISVGVGSSPVSYTHLTLPTNREV